VENRDVGSGDEDFDPDLLELNIPIHLHTFELLTQGCHHITAAVEDPDHLLMKEEICLQVVLQEIPLLEDAVLIMIRVSRSQGNSL
jgi:hypothetical protein